MPAGPGVRVDTGLRAGDRVPPDYDNLVAKIMVHAGDRGAAIDRLRRALDETEIAGIQTTLPFDRFMARHDGFRAGDLSIEWVGEHWDGPAERARHVSGGGRGSRPLGRGGRPGAARPGRLAGANRSRSRPGRTAARADATDRWPG